MRTSDFDYELPRDLIAQVPLPERDASRLMILSRAPGRVDPEHHFFRDLPGLLQAGDLLVVNDTRVIPARLRGRKAESGGGVEVLLVSPVGKHEWRAMVGASRPVRAGSELVFSMPELRAKTIAEEGGGFVLLRFDRSVEALLPLLDSGAGEMPLPAYIDRAIDGRDGLVSVDRERYQTIFASRPGAVAAPTAGLHFTDGVLSRLEAAGIELAALTLHVGPGTFLPVRVENPEEHRMHEEGYEIPERTAAAVRRTRSLGGRILAVGTTVLRALEAAATGSGDVFAGPGETGLFIRPGYRFRAVDGLLTNFHLPRSTLLMLVCALAGRERVLQGYMQAVERRYRFYSYGDAMLIL